MTALQRFQEAMPKDPKDPKDPKAKGRLAKRQILQAGFSHGEVLEVNRHYYNIKK